MADTVGFPLTTRARIALAIARGIAASRGDDDVTPSHIALGLLREAENPAVAALHRGGVDLRAIRRELEAELGPPGRPRPGEVALQLTRGERRIVDLATAESRRRKEEYLGPHHLLLAMLREPDSPTAQAFARHSFPFETAVTHLQFVFGGDSPPPDSQAPPPGV
jgi:ATP-dependent Clp protease ATP-binding subunit ClpC